MSSPKDDSEPTFFGSAEGPKRWGEQIAKAIDRDITESLRAAYCPRREVAELAAGRLEQTTAAGEQAQEDVRAAMDELKRRSVDE